MEIRFSNYIEGVRSHFKKIIKYIEAHSKTGAACNRNIVRYFLYLRDNNYTAYSQLLGLAMSDQLKLLYFDDKKSTLDEEDRLNLELLTDMYDNDDLVNLFEEDNCYILNAIDGLLDYDALDYFNKRAVLKECEPIADKLLRFSSLNLYDFMYYASDDYNVGTFKTIYEDCLRNKETKDEAIENLICTLDEIYFSSDDSKEYFELISELLATYYTIGKYELSLDTSVAKKDTLKKTIKFLESSDPLEIVKHLNEKDKFLVEVFKRYINFGDTNFTFDTSDEKYQKTLVKLKNIKEAFE